MTTLTQSIINNKQITNTPNSFRENGTTAWVWEGNSDWGHLLDQADNGMHYKHYEVGSNANSELIKIKLLE